MMAYCTLACGSSYHTQPPSPELWEEIKAIEKIPLYDSYPCASYSPDNAEHTFLEYSGRVIERVIWRCANVRADSMDASDVSRLFWHCLRQWDNNEAVELASIVGSRFDDYLKDAEEYLSKITPDEVRYSKIEDHNCTLFSWLSPPDAADTKAKTSFGVDGPVPPRKFRWNGAEHDVLGPIPWNLLNHLWKAENRAVCFADGAVKDALADAVWGDKNHIFSEDAVKSAAANLREFFVVNKIPLTCNQSWKSRTICITKKSSVSAENTK